MPSRRSRRSSGPGSPGRSCPACRWPCGDSRSRSSASSLSPRLGTPAGSRGVRSAPPAFANAEVVRREGREDARDRLEQGLRGRRGVPGQAQRRSLAQVRLERGDVAAEARARAPSRSAFPPARPFSSLAKSTTRIVRRGCGESAAICRAASITIPQPAPSSIAPVPRSQESRCAPRRTISSGFSRPVTSPITLADVASGRSRHCSVKCTRTGPPRRSRRASSSASGTESAAAGIRGAPVVVLEAAGVRQPVVVGADRSDEQSDGPQPRGGGGALRTGTNGLAVSGAVAGARHRAVDEDDAAPTLGGSLGRAPRGTRTARPRPPRRPRTFPRCRRARPGPGAEETGAVTSPTLGAALPHRHRHRLRPHARKALRASGSPGPPGPPRGHRESPPAAGPA